MSDSSEQTPKTDPASEEGLKKPNMLQVVGSVLAALFGVQKNSTRERDFKKGSAADFIAVYVILVIAFVIGMIAVVKSVLSSVQ